MDLSTCQRKVVLFTMLLAVVGLLCQYKIIFGCSETLSMHEKKLCKQEVIGMRMHQFKVSGLNSIHLICDSYFNLWFNMFKIGIAN